jgi:hypothetical protein
MKSPSVAAAFSVLRLDRVLTLCPTPEAALATLPRD